MRNALTRAAILACAFALSTTANAQGEDEIVRGFSFETPPITQTLPGLAARLESIESQARYRFDEWVEDWPEDARGPAFDALTYQQSWGVAGANEQLLSLASHSYQYSGGAHGGQAHAALIWDVAGDREMPLLRLFDNRYRALELIDRQFCPALQAMQAERGIAAEETEAWGGCPLYNEITIAPASNVEAGPFTHFDIVVGEYVAGPYVVGTFEIEVAMTPDLLALVRPEYRESFALPNQQ